VSLYGAVDLEFVGLAPGLKRHQMWNGTENFVLKET
jgi:hypothetical protein